MPDIGRRCKTARGDLEGAQATAGGRPRHPAGSRRRQHMAAPGRAEGDRHQASGSRQQRAAAAWQRQQAAAGSQSRGQRPQSKHSQQPNEGHKARREPRHPRAKRTTCSDHFKGRASSFKNVDEQTSLAISSSEIETLLLKSISSQIKTHSIHCTRTPQNTTEWVPRGPNIHLKI